jgi:UDP:flavonoid glycosyltransferase YjiC (YdhE family)
VKVVLASYGSRGDIEVSATVGRELLRRGHDVLMAVPPDHIDFVEMAGLPAVACGPPSRPWLDAGNHLSTCLFRSPWRIQELNRLAGEAGRLGVECWVEITKTLLALAEEADVLVTDLAFEGAAANVAEYHDIPLVTVHFLPVRANGRLLPFLPPRLARTAMRAYHWAVWRGQKAFEDAQRRELGLSATTGPLPQRITDRGSLEIQAYDDFCFPGLAAEWAELDGRRPFVGSLTMELPTDADDEAASWIAEGSPPIFFSFGSNIAVESPDDAIAMIDAACTQLGERALVCSAVSDFSRVAKLEHVKVVPAVNFAAIFPACRALVHHGGAGTTAAGLRAGVPMLIHSRDPGQKLLGALVRRLKVGKARRYSSATLETLVADLRTIFAPEYAIRAREIATRMTKAADSPTAAAVHVEEFARARHVG